MAGLDPATQPAHVRAPWRLLTTRHAKNELFRRVVTRRLGGRVKPGHDEFFVGAKL